MISNAFKGKITLIRRARSYSILAILHRSYLTLITAARFAELNPDESRWDQEDLKSSSINKEPSFSSEIARFRLTKTLPVQHDSAISSTNPDHRYVSEILSASGLLRELDSGSINFPLNLPDQLFTRKLLLALEQIKPGDRLSSGIPEIHQLKYADKLRKRLVFDVVNEILVEKYVRKHSKNWLGKSKDSKHQLLHGLCSEIDQLQTSSLSCSSDEEDDSLRLIIEKDLNDQSAVWAEGFVDISGVVLDVERLIFKDLVSEVVSGAAGHMLQARHMRYCRQLF